MCFKLFNEPASALPTKPSVILHQLPQKTVESEIESHDLVMIRGGLMDSKYYYTTLGTWQEIQDYIYDIYKYIGCLPAMHERKDCDDYAYLFKGLVGGLFGLNYCAYTEGMMPMGFHAFITVRTEFGLRLIEPNPDFNLHEPFLIGEHGYEPEKVML